MLQKWCRMRVRENVEPIEIRYWVAEQARYYHKYREALLISLRKYSLIDSQNELTLHPYRIACKALEKMLHIEEFNYPYKASAVARSMPMSLIGTNELFPLEWRMEVYRTLLPEEVEFQRQRWATYLHNVQSGKQHGYLLHWCLFSESNNAKAFWQALQDAVKYASQRTDAWAQNIMQTDIPQQIQLFPTPIVYPAPYWTDWEHQVEKVDYRNDERYIALQETTKQLHLLRHAWNQNAQKSMPVAHAPFATRSFEHYLRYGNKLDKFLAWLNQCVADGVGLYLWA